MDRLALCAPGCAPHYIAADATDRQALETAYARIKQRYAQIHGVIHAALGLYDQSLLNMDEARFKAILAVKIDAGVRMAQVFQKEPLDFMLFFSSIAAFGNAEGMSGYAAGCHFADAFALQLGAAGACHAKIVNWGYWRIGSGDRIAAALKKRLQHSGLRPIETHEGMQALESLLAAPVAQMAVLKATPAAAGALADPGEFQCVYPRTIPAVLAKDGDDGAQDAGDWAAVVRFADGAGAEQAARKDATEALILKLLCATLDAMGLFRPPATLPGCYAAWLAESKAILARRHFLSLDSEKEIPAVSAADLEKLWAAWEQSKQALPATSGDRPAFVLVEAALRALPAVLTGRQRAAEVLFPDGGMDRIAGLYKGNRLADYFNDVLGATLVKAIQERLRHDPAARIRIIEIGAGTGASTAAILPKLLAYRDSIAEYGYTDVSRAFLHHAEEHFAAQTPFLRMQLFDIEKPVAEQKIASGCYDIAIAANVLHATRSIRNSLRNVKAVLRRNGLLLLNELSDTSLVSHLTFGLLEGWWAGEDKALRMPGAPGLYPDAWRKVLAEEGFSPVLFPARADHAAGLQIVLAQSDGVVRQSASGGRAGSPTGDSATSPAVDVAAGEAPAVDPSQAIEVHVAQQIRDCLSRALAVPKSAIENDVPFSDYGIDSILTVNFVKRINAALDIALNATTIFDHSTVDHLTQHILSACRDRIAVKAAEAPAAVCVGTARAPQPAIVREKGADAARPVEIAVIGMSGQFPDAADVSAFWRNLVQGRSGIRPLPDHYLDPAAGADSYKWGGILETRDCFDPLFFNISPREAESMNPHQRLVLQESWKALEDAGCNPKKLAGSRSGIYIGAEPTGYLHETFTGASEALIASRLSYYLDLKGPALVVNTGCSSSGVALHLACESLRHKETDLAIAGGVFAAMSGKGLAALAQIGMLSPTGQCRTFDAAGDGTVLSEGIAIVVLKRLADALREGDPIHGVIQASGMNQDGASNGITAPSGSAQETLITEVYRRFGIDPAGISYVEAHGTGTPLGDPVEANALVRAFKQFTDRKHYCAVGSAKSQIGHTGAAAAAAGLIKVLLCLKHRMLPGLLHFQQLNPLVEFDDSAFFVNPDPMAWHSPDGRPLRAALNSFGHSGTNVHLVISAHAPQACAPEQFPAPPAPALVPLSARTAERLKVYAHELAVFLEAACVPAGDTPQTGHGADPGVALRDLAYTLQQGRQAMETRAAFIAKDMPELIERLKRFGAGESAAAQCFQGDGQPQGAAATRETLLQWIAEGRQAQVAEFWVRGGALDWDLLYAQTLPRRISLPTYPFAREKYWMPQADRSARPSGMPNAAPPANLQPADSENAPDLLLCRPRWVERAAAGQPATGTPYARHLVLLCGFGPGPGGTDLLPTLEARIADAVCQAIKSDAPTPAARYRSMALQVFEIIKGLLAQKTLGQTLIQLLVPSRGESELLAGLGGLLKTAQLEHPAIRGQWIAVAPDSDAAALTRSITENAACPGDTDIRYDDGRRSVAAWEELPQRPESDRPWRDGGVYLITGGAGGLGLIFAAQIAAQTRDAVLILAGRSPLSPEKERKLAQIASSGARIAYRQADISQAREVEGLIQHIQAQFGGLQGILHGAGIVQDSFMLKKTAAQFEAVLGPKVDGTLNLDLAAKALRLDFFVLFSSTASVFGSVGQADYAAANGFMDAFAEYRNRLVTAAQRHGRTLAVHWPLWQEGGMRVDDATAAVMRDRAGMSPMPTAAGLRAFGQAWAASHSRIMVMQGVRPALKQWLTAGKPAVWPASVDTPAGAADVAGLKETTRRRLRRLMGETIKLSPDRIDPTAPLEKYGIDSIMITRLNQQLETVFRAVPKTLFFEYPTLDALAGHLAAAYPRECLAWAGPAQTAPEGVSAVSPGGAHDRPGAQTNAHAGAVRDAQSGKREPIAIIGLSGHYAAADTPDALWEHFRSGRDCITQIPPERWPLEGFFDDDPEAAIAHGKSYSKWGSFLSDFACFDPFFFNISPREAMNMDPQERLFLQCAWEVFEDAGYTRNMLAQRHRQRVGVFAGITKTGYNLYGPELWRSGAAIYPHTSFGSVANRISYALNLQGPSMPIDTMCSSSLTAIHEACEHLLRGECELALAGGVNLYLHPSSYIVMCAMRMLSKGSRCKSFGQGADGFVPGEGVGAVLLKPLSLALRDRDHIYAVIRSSGVNHGGKTNGYTVPNPHAQSDLIRQALEKAGVHARTVSYIEAHGTGTELGDPIEIAGLSRAFQSQTQATGFCAIGSAKSNLGHLEAAAGIAGLTKIILQMQHGQLAPSLHAVDVNPNIDFAQTPFVLQQTLAPWQRPVIEVDGQAREYPRLAGISSFGAGGANAHLIVEEFVAEPSERPEAPAAVQAPALIVLSAKDAARLKDYAARLLAFIGQDAAQPPEIPLTDLAYTLQTGREAMEERLGFIAGSIAELKAGLTAFIAGDALAAGVYRGRGDRELAGIGHLLNSDQDMAQTFAAWIAKGKYAQLLELWVRGVDVDWENLYGDRKPRRISLPTYPFARQRFWIGAQAGAAHAGVTSGNQDASDAHAGVAQRTPGATDQLAYIAQWEAQPPASPSPARPPYQCVLVVHGASAAAFAATVAADYRNPGRAARVIRIQLAHQTRPLSAQAWACAIDDPAAMATCLQACPDIDCVYFIADAPIADGSAGGGQIDGDSLTRYQQQNEIQLLRLFNYLKQQAGPAAIIDCTIVTRDNYRIGRSAPDAYGGGLTGLAYAMAQGDHRFRVRNIDVDSEDLLDAERQNRTLAMIAAEPACPRGDVVKLSAGTRYTRTFRGLDWGTLKNRSGFKQQGVYVLLGGSGTVGQAVTRQLIHKYSARVIWIGRTPPDDAVLRAKIAAYDLQAAPAYFQADVTRPEEMRQAVARIKAQFPHINGAMFAGVVFTFGAPAAQIEEKAFADVIDVKTKGSFNFYSAWRAEPLDFMCYFSSGQAFAFSGAARMPAYAAGITFSDTLIRSLRAAAAFPIGSINWGFWRSSFAGQVPNPHVSCIEDDEGFACLERFTFALQADRLDQVLCMRVSAPVQKLMHLNPEETLRLAEADCAAPGGGVLPAVQSKFEELSGRLPEAAHSLPEEKFQQGFNQWLVHRLFEQVRHMGICFQTDAFEDIESLRKRAGVRDQYARWWQECCALLASGGYLLIEAGQGRQCGHSQLEVNAKLCREWESQRESHPQDMQQSAATALAEACLKRLPEILKGAVLPTEVLFPNASIAKVETIYGGNSGADFLNAVATEAALTYINARSSADPQAKIRLIEIGAGTGATTAVVLPRLRPFQEHIQNYCFSDISKAFLLHAQKHFGTAYPFLECRLWNIEQPPAAQGIDTGYDIAIAVNVLHATQNIRRTLRNAKAALKPKGILIVSEATRKTPFSSLTFGLLDGWWRYEDAATRIPGSPLLNTETWRQVLEEEGFAPVFFPPGSALGQAVIVAESDGLIRAGARCRIAVQPAPLNPVRSAAPPNHTPAALPELSGAGDDRAALRRFISGLMIDALARSLETSAEQIDPGIPFSDYGLDSILGVGFVDQINSVLGLALKTAILFDYTSVSSLTKYISDHFQDQITAHHGVRASAEKPSGASIACAARQSSGLVSALETAAPMDAVTAAPSPPARDCSAPPEEIAVIGMSGQFPGATDTDTFWRNLIEGRDGVRELPTHYLTLPPAAGHTAAAGSAWGGVLEERACFDPLFFNISPREAESMNPHQRLIMQESWKALEDAGINPRSLENTLASLFIGAEPNGYAHESFTGASDAIIASRLSYFLNLKGPAMVVNTGCSSSGVAIHLACESLRNRESHLAIAGGVFAALNQSMLQALAQIGMLSPSGRCNTFDAAGDGTVLSEGVGIVILKRLAAAIAAGDPIYGIIKASGLNQDGASNGITAPNGVAQEELISALYQRYQIDPRQISYIEAHGTGTQLGDPVEANALVRAFKRFTDETAYCAVGSAKSHIGHTAAGAGVIGLIKILLSLRHHQLPGLLHFRQLNPAIAFNDSPFYIQRETAAWRAKDHTPLMAALNSFGHSGTNVHLVVKEYLPAQRPRPAASADTALAAVRLIPLSAKTDVQLKTYAQKLLSFLKSPQASDPPLDLADLAYTLQCGREPMKMRVVFMAGRMAELIAQLESFLAGGAAGRPEWRTGRVEDNKGAMHFFDADEDAQTMMRNWIEKGKHHRVAELWVQGIPLDWNLFYGEEKPRKRHLPTYPFARESYWADGPAPGRLPGPSPEAPGILIAQPVWKDKAAAPDDHRAGYAAHWIMWCDLNPREEALIGKAIEKGMPGAAWVRLTSGERAADKRFTDIAVQLFARVKEILTRKPEGKTLLQVLIPSEGEGALLAGLGGLLKTAHLENPHFFGQLIAVAPDADAQTLLRIIRENSRSTTDAHVRYRGPQRQVPAWAEAGAVAGADLPWKDNGIYLITGGSGGLGMIFASEIAARVHTPTLILTGRAALRPDQQTRIAKLASRGARIEYRPADVSRLREVEDLIKGIAAECGPLNGILHCAGIIQDNFIIRKTTEAFQAVLAPKVTGTLNLDQATRDGALDFFVLFSSVSAALGNPGQADYSAANAFMDAFAEYRNERVRLQQRQGRTLSINWPLWREGGMRLDAARVQLLTQNGVAPLETSAGMRALMQGWAGPHNRMMVLAGDAGRIKQALFENPSPARPDASAHAISAEEKQTLQEKTAQRLTGLLAEAIKLPADRIEPGEPLEHYGIDSITITHLNAGLAVIFGEIPKTLFYEYRSLNELAGYFCTHYAQACLTWTGGAPSASVPASPAALNATGDRQPAGVAPRKHPLQPFEPIAIIGLTGRYPQADTIHAFWENLKAGRTCITEIPPLRWPLASFYEAEIETAVTYVKSYCKHGGFLGSFAEFDPLFFNISPADAFNMDPQERLMLTTCWQAMEDSGYSRKTLQEQYNGSVGVFIGITKAGFNLHTRLGADLARSRLPSTSFSSMANRVSYHLNLTGPSMAIDTMCASAITALHEACEHIRRGECQLALAGAVNLYLHPRTYIDLCLGKMITDEGRIHCFSKTGKGFIPGEGVGAVLLKPLARAEADGDRIAGVIRGTAINHGGKTLGYTVPNLAQQRELIRTVLQRAQCEPDAIDYIESAANGSAMGDAIEFQALRQVFQQLPRGACFLGTVKPNIGHLEAAAGMSQLTKVLCQMQHRTLAPTCIQAQRLDESLHLEQSPFTLVTEAQPWPTRVEESGGASRSGRHTVLITSFGAGGSYAAMVVEEAMPRADAQPAAAACQAPQLVLLSARARDQLKQSASALLAHLEASDDALPSLAYTLQEGRDAMRYRLAIVAHTPEALCAHLQAYLRNEDCQAVKTGDARQLKALTAAMPQAEIAALTQRALAARDLTSLADLWCKGYNAIAWRALHDAPPRRCSLPTYPFAARTFWYDHHPSQQTGIESDLRVNLIGVIKEILFMRAEDELDEEATFLDLGLDSINGVRFMRQLSAKLDRPLRETLIFDYPTIGELSAYLAHQRPEPREEKPAAAAPSASPPETGVSPPLLPLKDRWRPIMQSYPEVVPLQPAGDGPVLFCMHPMSGDVGHYAHLAEAAGTRFRVVGIRSRGFLTSQEPLTDIQAMGHYDAQIITTVQPQGPYHLLGSSMGGTVAYETARQLQLGGKSVAHVFLIEAPLIENDADAALWDSADTENWIMNANFLMITLLHLDPEFRRRKSAGEIKWPRLEITLDQVRRAQADRPEADIAGTLVELVRQRGVKQAADILMQRLQSMARIHLTNLKSLGRYRAAALPVQPDASPRIVLLRTLTAAAVSGEVYNPDYLYRVQQAKGSLEPFFEGWRKIVPQLETCVVSGRNHFDLLNTQGAIQHMSDLIAQSMAAPRPCGALSSPCLAQAARADAAAAESAAAHKIAIIGASGQFAGTRNLDEFWDLLKNGRTAFMEFPRNRGWDLDRLCESEQLKGGFLKEIDQFDPLFFNIPPHEADMMDPAERFFLQESWRAIENAGIAPASLSGRPWGVFCGGGGDYTLLLKEKTGVSPHVTVSGIPGRVSYTLNLSGPCLSVDAGCASALLAVAQACDQLRLGTCEAAVAGGVLINTTPNLIAAGCRAGLFSRGDRLDPQGRQGGAFDAGANGMTPGEAVGVVILKPLARAIADGDRILGVIEGWGNNHNGRTNGMAAPSVRAQEALFAEVYRRFGIDPESIGLVEANAGGTPLGDTMEVQALSAAFQRHTSKQQFCALGSVENNIGHSFQASGMGHLMKVLLALRHHTIPATVNMTTPNPALALDHSPFFINTRNLPWADGDGRPRRATVSSYGTTGANVHLVIAAPPAVATRPARRLQESIRPVLIVLSAKTPLALKQRCLELIAFLDSGPAHDDPSLPQLSANLWLRRDHFAVRCALVVSSRKALKRQLQRLIDGDAATEGFVGTIPKTTAAAPQASLKIAAEKARTKKELLDLAQRYIQGVPLDFTECFTAAEKFPIGLPAYPFERRHCWVRTADAQTRPPEVDAGGTAAPSAAEIREFIQAGVTAVTGYRPGEVDADSSFSRMGLDSLMSMRLLAIVNECFALEIKLADLLEHNSIERLAALVEGRIPRQGGAVAVPLSPPLSAGGKGWFAERLAQLPKTLQVTSQEGKPS